jgi:hypothetical protein
VNKLHDVQTEHLGDGEYILHCVKCGITGCYESTECVVGDVATYAMSVGHQPAGSMRLKVDL